MTWRRALGMLSVAAGAVCLIQTSAELSVGSNIILIVIAVGLVLLGLQLFEK
ncbi:hypothetical protein ACFSO0_15215 [Brevibacillus sp. GCM10020057]|uniref:hypothetical protein n=1 Tax=Brevibacillus sp. GCM10020057 TaxID=3317327 RepID=UPI003632E684